MEEYLDPKSTASFGGIKRLKSSANTETLKEVKDFLAKTPAYTLHKQRRLRFPRRKYIVAGIDSLWQADLADMSSLSRFNAGFRFLLVVVDVFSKYCFIEPIKRKTANQTADAFLRILDRSHGRRPEKIMTDKGGEFAKLNRALTIWNVHHYTAEDAATKAAVAERLIRTVKGRIYRYLTHKKTKRYIDVLQDLVSSYNRSYHRTIGTAPVNVTKENETSIRARLYSDQPTSYPPKFNFKIGDKVRISLSKKPFDKGYRPTWSDEVFKVEKQLATYPPVYELSDENMETILGTFYEAEMQKVA